MRHTIASWLLPFRHFGFRAPCAVLALSRRACCARQRRVKLKGLGHGSRDFLFPEVVGDEPWPYGLVGDEKSEFYARQLDGDFFADVKNSDLFLQALQEDAEEKQVDADDHLNSIDRKATEFLKGGSNRQRKIVDRESFIDSLTDAISRDGKLTLVLGGKSVGKTLVVSHVAEQVRQAPGGNRTTLLVNMRQMPADDFYEATLSVASKQTNVLDILTQLPLFGKRFRAGPQSRVWRFIQQLPFMATLLGAWRAGMAAAAAPLATSVQNALASLNDRAKAECLAQLVNDIKKNGNNTAIIIDEANLALPNDGNNAKADTAKTALAQITGETKEAFTASVVLISSEHGYPFKLAKAGLNLVDIKNIIIAPEVPPVDMFKMLTHHWGMGHRLARLFVATYGGSIHAVYTALGNLMNKGDQFYPLRTTSVPGIGICLDQARCWQVLFCVSRGKAGSHLNSC